MIRVLIADDSKLTRAVLRDIIQQSRMIEVAGEAENGREAVSLTKQLRPDLIIMDIMMPVMNGLDAIEEIMAHAPTPILVLSATVDDRDVNLAFNAIKKGALDVMEKPDGIVAGSDTFGGKLIDKIRLLARIKVIRHHRRQHKPETAPIRRESSDRRSILAIGASTGGPKAVMSIIKNLPADLPATVFVVQHIASGFAKGFAQWLDRECRIPVLLAEDGLTFKEGQVLVAPNDCHLKITGDTITLAAEEPVNACRPSIDVLFTSLAQQWGRETVAVLLTGMGRDGAEGLRQIKGKGGFTIVQDESSCAVFGMPKAALSLDAADRVLGLSEMPETIKKIFCREGGALP